MSPGLLKPKVRRHFGSGMTRCWENAGTFFSITSCFSRAVMGKRGAPSLAHSSHSRHTRSSKASKHGSGVAPGRSRRAVAGSDVPHRMVGKCVCGTCQQTSDQVAWKFFCMDSGRSVPCDDKCEGCWGKFVSGPATYMSWEDFCTWSKTDEGKAVEAEIKHNSEKPGPVDFAQKTVVAGRAFRAVVKQSLLVLNEGEYTTYMKHKPLARHPATARHIRV